MVDSARQLVGIGAVPGADAKGIPEMTNTEMDENEEDRRLDEILSLDETMKRVGLPEEYWPALRAVVRERMRQLGPEEN